MKRNELLDILEIKDWKEFQYYEQFLLLMEHYELINEEVLFKAFAKISPEDLSLFLEMYFDDIMTGIPEDNIDLYKIFSTVKSVLTEMAYAKDAMRIMGQLVFELYRFLGWMMEDKRVHCRDLIENTVKEISIYESLILFRIERLNEGKYELNFSEEINFHIDEFEKEESVFPDEDTDQDMMDDESGLIDPENPVLM